MIQITDGKWDFSSVGDLPTAIDLFINVQRTTAPKRARCKINKEHNYKFKTLNR